LSANFRGKKGRLLTTLGVRKLEPLGYHVVLYTSRQKQNKKKSTTTNAVDI